MAKLFMYGLVGRWIKIDNTAFYGHSAYKTKAQGDKEAIKARNEGRLARVVPNSSGLRGYVLMVSKKKGER